jgi:hypothetical protein
VIWFTVTNGIQAYHDALVGQVPTSWTIQGLDADFRGRRGVWESRRIVGEIC